MKFFKVLLLFLIIKNFQCYARESLNFECVKEGYICNEEKRCENGFSCQNIYFNPVKEIYEGVCKRNQKLGYNCEYLYECELGTNCYKIDKNSNYTCMETNYIGIGDNCENDYECMGKLSCIKSQCQFIKTNENIECNYDVECRSQHYCNKSICQYQYNNDVYYQTCSKCLPVKDVGSDCYSSGECNINSTCFNNKCILKYSIKEGEGCDGSHEPAYACESKEYDYSIINNSIKCKCVKNNSYVNYNCSKNQYCPNDEYYCNLKTNKCLPKISTSNDCKRYMFERDQCYINNNCIILNEYEKIKNNYFNKKSCYMKHCKKETLIFSQRCDNYYKLCI